ncbi:MAG: hypothetical protein LBJ88_03880 [Campylobacteraceae bacterium]|jgi:hypothetical protein|nr:hypothetical protein [Campylobacteraceae bacterium]
MNKADDVIKSKWGWALARLRHSYSKYGIIVIWSKKEFAKLFEKFGTKESAYEPYILEQLKKLNDERKIDFIGNDDIYFKVINI